MVDMRRRQAQSRGYRRSGDLLFRKFREFLLPTIFLTVSNFMAVILDGIIVGNLLGQNQYAAVNVVGPVMQIYTTLAVACGMGAASAISVAKGRRENEKANAVFRCMILLLLLAGLLTVAVQAAFFDRICGWLSADAALTGPVRAYYRNYVYGAPFIVFLTGVLYTVRSDGMPRLASGAMVLANLVNIGCDLLFMGVLGSTVAGASAATVIGYAAGTLLLLIYIRSPNRSLHWKPVEASPFRAVPSMLAAGAPPAVSSTLNALKAAVANMTVQTLAGSGAMVAMSVCLSCFALTGMFISGVCQTMMPLISTLHGERDRSGIRFVLRRAAATVLTAVGACVVLIECVPGAVMRLFGADATALGLTALRIYAASLIPLSLTYLAMNYLTSTERKTAALITSILEGAAVAVPCCLLLPKVLGITGVWISFLIAEAVSLLFVVLCLFFSRRKKAKQEAYEKNEIAAEFSIGSTVEDASGVSERVIALLRKGGISEAAAVRAGIAVEEIAANIALHGGDTHTRADTVDIRIRLAGQEVVISVRDAGKPFDPTLVLPEEMEEGYCVNGLALIRAIGGRIVYFRANNLNNTVVIIGTSV